MDFDVEIWISMQFRENFNCQIWVFKRIKMNKTDAQLNWNMLWLNQSMLKSNYVEKNIFNQLLFFPLCVLSTLYFNRPHKHGSKTLSLSDKSYWKCQKCSFPFLTCNFSLRSTFFSTSNSPLSIFSVYDSLLP